MEKEHEAHFLVSPLCLSLIKAGNARRCAIVKVLAGTNTQTLNSVNGIESISLPSSVCIVSQNCRGLLKFMFSAVINTDGCS